jgi:hypothetical protein
VTAIYGTGVGALSSDSFYVVVSLLEGSPLITYICIEPLILITTLNKPNLEHNVDHDDELLPYMVLGMGR